MIAQKKDLRARAMRVIGKLPPLSAGASRFLGALTKRDVETSQLVAIIQRDPMLAPRVLELANSGVFGRARHIESIPHAVALLGPTTLRRYGLRWTFGGLFRGLPDMPRWSTSRFTSHAEAMALLADILCDQLPIGNLADGAFIAGLVHDIGKFAICTEASDTLDFLMTMRAMSEESASEVERAVLGIDHAEISSMAAEKWRLGDEVCEAIRYHHEPGRDPGSSRINLSFVLSKCDAFVNGLGLEFLSTPADASDTLDCPGYSDQVAQTLKVFESALSLNGVAV